MSSDSTTEHGSVGPDGRYVLVSRIATGGMGEVWRAEDTALGRTVAVKLLKTEYSGDAQFRSRFESEARHAAALTHPGIAAVYDVGESAVSDGGPLRPFLVMELVDGQPLSNLIRPSAPMDPGAVRDLLAQVGDALGVAHRAGIVHRDIKPANLLVTPERQIKVTDFGIARAAEAVALTQTGQVMGTPQYLSPEQAEGGRATAASDVYSLAVVAFECLTGRRPFEAESPVATALAHLRSPIPDLPTSVPADLAAVVRRGLAKDPEERFVDGSAFAAALRDPATHAIGLPAAGLAPTEATAVIPPTAPEPVTQVVPVTAGVPIPVDPADPTGTNRRVEEEHRGDKVSNTALLITIVVLLALLAGVFLWWQANRDDPVAPPETTNSASPTPEESEEPESIDVDPDDYIGEDFGTVRSALRELGLRVARDEQTNPGDETPGEVTGVNPSGSLEPGERVTVSFWGEPPAEEPEPEPTPTPTPEPEPEPEPEPTPTPTPTAEPAPTPTPTETTDPTPPPAAAEAPSLRSPL
ncbi:protein kinase domain-containing protein [Nocardioides gilvus]|uniref:protein kinase domain-containing protein n=1 Tax=Nocardioides gilvus TaxID=1735589 RepID=UPI000D74923D|nr:protein kinase [Nocardioides gilvus]